jgi:hypothetical protein
LNNMPNDVVRKSSTMIIPTVDSNEYMATATYLLLFSWTGVATFGLLHICHLYWSNMELAVSQMTMRITKSVVIDRCNPGL